MSFIKKIISVIKNLFSFNRNNSSKQDKSDDEPDNIYPMW